MVIKKINLFLVHTPLQLISALIVMHQYFSDAENILLYEGDELGVLAHHLKTPEIYSGKQTRTVTHHPALGIRYNLGLLQALLDKHKPDQVHLFASELQWMCNKAFYATLKKKFKDNFICSFFDEGLHIYVNNEAFSEENKLKTILKYVWMRLHRLPSTAKFTSDFFIKKEITAIYCYHTHLIDKAHYSNASIQSIDANGINHLIKETLPVIVEEPDPEKKLLLLSQAYYWDISEQSYKQVMIDLMHHFKARGVKNFYIKPHHSDKPEWIDFMQKELGFRLAPFSKDIAIELYAKQLTYDYIVSVSSSALLNLQVFGFPGALASFGAKRCSLTNKFRDIHNLILPLFCANNIEVVD